MPLKPRRAAPGTPLEEWLWTRVDKDGPTMPGMDSPCWMWTGGTTHGLYDSDDVAALLEPITPSGLG
jgi:hypothetical protein